MNLLKCIGVVGGAISGVSWFLWLGGCSQPKTVGKPPAVAPPPTFTGPSFLRGTVGSLVRIRGFEPMLVSGWGFVTQLDGTGDTTAPSFIKRWMIQRMSVQGLGSARLKTTYLTPEI